MDQELGDSDKRVCQNPVGDNSRNLADTETVIEMGDNGIVDSNVKSSGSTMNEPVSAGDADKTEGEEDKSSSCVIDVKEFVGEKENQRVCRVCHLSAKESGKSIMDLIELGCGCKGELAVAHLDCAEAWFRVKGNRLCEICGETAKNITGVRDNGFMEQWNERRAIEGVHSTSSDRSRCLGRQPLCNFLMACLVVAFVLPWFFRVNMF